MPDIDEIRRCFAEDRFVFSAHAIRERGRARLTVSDIQQAGRRAEILSEETDQSGGVRVLIAGQTDFGQTVHIVIVLLSDAIARIVTVYERKSKRQRR